MFKCENCSVDCVEVCRETGCPAHGGIALYMEAEFGPFVVAAKLHGAVHFRMSVRLREIGELLTHYGSWQG